MLNPFQEEACAALDAHRSVLLSAPTGAGKTLVAEYAIEKALERGKRAIYTAPIKALSSQKFRDFQELGIDVGIMTGDVTLHPHARVLVMTTEIFRNTIFENPGDLADVDTVVFDEIHYMDDPERGTVWEESIIFAPPHVRFVCLSATVSNLGEFGEWISRVRGEEIAVVRHDERPVPLIHYFFFPGTGPRRAEKVKKLPVVKRRRRERGPKWDVLDHVQQRGELPVLFFCFSRKDCERRARAAHRRELLDRADSRRLVGMFDELCERFQIPEDETLRELRHLAAHGVGYHHAGLLPLHKELIERLFTSGLLRLLFTTETFALGINMPARTVVFSSLRKFDGTGFDYIKTREYQQMAGRAGRQGMDEVGLVYSVIDDPRQMDLERLRRIVFGQVEPIRSRFNLSYSSLLNLRALLGDRLYEAWERSFRNFQWRRMPRAKRRRNEEKQRRLIDAKLDLLAAFGYLDADGALTEKGRVAALVNGFELPITELYASDLLHWLDEIQIAVVAASLVFEERRGDVYRRLDPSVLAEHRRDVERIVGRLVEAERERGIPPTVRPPNFRIGSVVVAFANGRGLHELGEWTNASPGDIVRVLRLTVQVLRQLLKAVKGDRAFAEKLRRTIALLWRDEVDAKRQLELGAP